MLLYVLLVTCVIAQAPPNCSRPVDLSNPSLIVFSILTNCLINPFSNVNPRRGVYYDITTVPMIVVGVTIFASAALEPVKYYQPNALGNPFFGLDIPSHRRPQSESTPLNINTAVSYSMLRVADAYSPWAVQIHPRLRP